MKNVDDPARTLRGRDLQALIDLANQRFALWDLFSGCGLVNSAGVRGRIESVRGQEGRAIISFSSDGSLPPLTYSLKIFLNGGIDSLSIPPDADPVLFGALQELDALEQARLADLERARAEAERKRKEQEQEERARIERATRQRHDFIRRWKPLWERYGIDHEPYDRTDHKLHVLLISLEEGQELSDEDQDWLLDQRLAQVIGSYFEICFDYDHDAWWLVKASAMWRRADQPDRAIQTAKRVTRGNHLVLSAKRTTIGGALRDLGFLDEAEEEAKAAIEYREDSYYPYNLLGAIYYQRGELGIGDDYFAKARERGAPSWTRDSNIKSILDDPNTPSGIRSFIQQHIAQKRRKLE